MIPMQLTMDGVIKETVAFLGWQFSGMETVVLLARANGRVFPYKLKDIILEMPFSQHIVPPGRVGRA